jgi:predicted glycoside hydrolase/deacetylase ChbG (UPF0249 family)
MSSSVPVQREVPMTSDSNSTSTNALLGYPEDAKLLILNADDFGMCHANNAAILQALLEGVATSTTMMTPCPWAPQALQMLRAHPEIPFGVHLTLISEFPVYRWGPVASKNEVRSLIDKDGFFFRFDRQDILLGQARIEEVETEFRAQIDTVLSAGLRPTHLDWHCLADGGRPDIFALTFHLAREHGLAMRIHLPESAAHCRSHGLPVRDHPVQDSYRYAPAEKASWFTRLLKDLPPGLTEWAIHPSLGDAEARALEPDTWQIRRADYDFALAPSTRELIEQEGIVLLDFRALQRAWAGER